MNQLTITKIKAHAQKEVTLDNGKKSFVHDQDSYFVEFINNESEGEIECASFYGHNAEERATKYAKEFYPDVALEIKEEDA